MPRRGTFISVGKSLDQAVERVKRAETLGYESTYVTHIAGRDSLTVLMAYAADTERIKLGTGVLPIYSRTPVATAQQAATIDEYSGGRMALGIGISHQVTVENWFQSRIERPLLAMREYVGILRACFGARTRRRARSSGRGSASWASSRGPSFRSTWRRFLRTC